MIETGPRPSVVGTIRAENCACGGSIVVVLPAADQTVAAAVLRHVRTDRHVAWARRERFIP